MMGPAENIDVDQKQSSETGDECKMQDEQRNKKQRRAYPVFYSPTLLQISVTSEGFLIEICTDNNVMLRSDTNKKTINKKTIKKH